MRRENDHQSLWNSVFRSVGEINQELLKLGLEENGTQENLDEFLKGWDIDKSPIQCVVLVAHIMKSLPDLSFPSALIPRLNGVLSYCRFKNLHIETILNDIINLFKNNSITYNLLGDWAMKGLRPEYPRWINSIDILVPVSEYDHAAEEALSIKSDTEVNIIQSLHDGFSPETLVFFALLNLYERLLDGQSIKSCITTFIDINYLYSLNKGFDTGIIMTLANKYNRVFQVALISRVVDSVMPGLFNNQWQEPCSLSRRTLKKRLVDFLYRRDVLSGTDNIILKEGTRRGLIPSVIKHLIWCLVSKFGL
ncbi:MAG: hypothetical protein IKW89_09150 [Bacteroidales bacterium]|nr:hypothetical protein [Bacteroidales bacterium]